MTTTITGLPNGTTPLDGTERVPMDQAGVTVDATTQDIADLSAEIQQLTCRNQTGSTIAKGTAVSFAGTLGASGILLIKKTIADGTDPGYVFLGIAKEQILNGETGEVATFGKIVEVDTSAFSEGSILWCDPATPGGLTETEPEAPNLKLPVAVVINSGGANGSLMVRSNIGSRLADLHDVQANGSKTDGDALRWDAAAGRWQPEALATVATTGAYSDLTGTPTQVANLDDLGDVDLTTTPPADGEALVYDSATGDWVPGAAAAQLGDLTDVVVTTPSDGQVLEYDSATGQWINATPTGGGGTPGGSSGQIQWNDAGAFAGVGGSTVGATGDITLSLNGATSTPPLKLTGTWFSGGTGTTTKPQLLIEPSGTTSTAWSTSGTGLGVNAASGFNGNLLDLQVGGTSVAQVNRLGQAVFGTIGIDNFILGASTIGIARALAHVSNQLVLNTAGASWSVASGTKANLNTFNAHAISFGSDSLISQGGYSSSKAIRVLSPNSDVLAPTLTIEAASALSSASTNIVGGAIALAAGSGASASAGSANGGSIQLDGGRGYGTGTDGNIIIGATRGNLQITDARDVILGTTTGTKIGTATTQKLGFYNATPVVQPSAVANITTTATSGSLPTPDGTVTIADATTPTVTELLEYCVELEAKLEAALGHLRTLGLIAT